EILVSTGIAGGVELDHHLSERYYFLAIEVPAALGKGLVFDVQRCHTGFFVFLDCAIDVESSPITRIGVSDERHTDGGGDGTGVAQLSRAAGEPQVRFPHTRHRRSCPGHVDHWKTLALNDLGGKAIICPRCDDDPGLT